MKQGEGEGDQDIQELALPQYLKDIVGSTLTFHLALPPNSTSHENIRA